MKSRAIRRHHRQRVKNNRSKYTINNHPTINETPKPCSCWMCGNPRKHHKELSIQEKKFLSEDINERLL